MTSVRIWPRCRFGVRFRVWRVFWAGSPRPKKVAEGAEKVHKVRERTHQSLMCCGDAPPSLALWSPPVRPVKVSPHLIHAYFCTQHMETLLLPAPPPAHAGPCKPCRAHACPRLRTKLPGFASPAPNYRCTWMWYPYRYPYSRDHLAGAAPECARSVSSLRCHILRYHGVCQPRLST